MNSSLFGALVAAGVAAVSAAAIVVLVIARRHAKSRAKLAGLRTPDPEASKDYQELCRARMQAKWSDKLAESPKAFDFGRLLESGKSESARSSTSSWCEEPPTSNMDIATGHVVLVSVELVCYFHWGLVDFGVFFCWCLELNRGIFVGCFVALKVWMENQKLIRCILYSNILIKIILGT